MSNLSTNKLHVCKPIKAHIEDAQYHSTRVLDDDWLDDAETYVTHKPKHILYEEYGWNDRE